MKTGPERKEKNKSSSKSVFLLEAEKVFSLTPGGSVTLPQCWRRGAAPVCVCMCVFVSQSVEGEEMGGGCLCD